MSKKVSPNLGRVVIDWLELSYQNNSAFKEEIIKLEVETTWRGYRIIPTRSCGYEYAFDVYWSFGDTRPFAQIKFHMHAKRKDYHIVVSINNRIFYGPRQDLTDALLIGEKLGLVYNNIRRMDLAIDLPKDITRLINCYQHKKNIALRVNGKCIWGDNEDTGLTFIANGHRKRNKLNGFFLHTSNKSASIKSYDKIKEITDKQHDKYSINYKDYILDYYSRPDKLYRLEVSARGRFIYDFIKRKGIRSLDMYRMLSDEVWLTSLFHDWLSSILSFSHLSVSKTGKYRSRGGVSWNEILGVPCITSINYTQYAIDKGISSVFADENTHNLSQELFNTGLVIF